MVISTMVNIKMDKCTEKASLKIIKVIYMMVNFIKILKRVLEFLKLKVANVMKEISTKIKDRVKAC